MLGEKAADGFEAHDAGTFEGRVQEDVAQKTLFGGDKRQVDLS
jgi:hypothetical protein